MRFFTALLTLSFLFNAVSDQWAFDFSKTGAKWIAADLALALLCAWVTVVLHRRHEYREFLELEQRRLAREQAASEAESGGD
jgi:hypothetical protein